VKQKEFGVKGPEVTIIGQGTWYIDRGDRKSAVAALRRGIEPGKTHIDTAEMYGDAELVNRGCDRGRQARRPLSRLQGAAEQRISSRHHCRLRAIADAAEDRSPRSLPAALARILST
jgi:aryl-alcohol dehydrogenase-like predicted oxidoreductase